jgi:hypothetical protein
VFVSSPENLARLEEYRQMNAKLADPRGVSQAELDQIVANGKAVIVQSFDLHSQRDRFVADGPWSSRTIWSRGPIPKR